MLIEAEMAPLVRFLASKSPMLHGKLLELRRVIAQWLSYVPQTFPHYTRHTVEHSDVIVSQLSKILFEESDVSRPVLDLSGMEVYILLAAAYLHDAGMVASDDEKRAILESTEWGEWSSSAGTAERIADIYAFSHPDPLIQTFVQSLQLRFILADYLRAQHHLRAKMVIEARVPFISRFAFDDAMLTEAVVAVCVGHGLRPQDLLDETTYPTRRDILEEQVNVRLIAVLLRLGDLLDLSTDRACPLLLSAASPLPPGSAAHWSQYRRITHRLSTPQRLEITAACETQDEHRILSDWCGWLVDEARSARLLLSRSGRHEGWKPPDVTMDAAGSSTIKIRPAAGVSYVPKDWKFELDRDAIYQRLISDLYTSDSAFLRELIQNSCDATRARVFADWAASGAAPAQNILSIPEEFRNRYPITISIARDDRASDGVSPLNVLAVDDCGIGMNTEVIEKYFLQVGRSFYQQRDFRKRYGFVPLSRFGVGFLSVFSCSDDVSVDTRHIDASSTEHSIALRLFGPKSYFYVDRGVRRTPGTRVGVRLRSPLSFDLARFIDDTAAFVEFPINLLVDGETIDIFQRELPNRFEATAGRDGSMFSVRALPFKHPNADGSIYVTESATNGKPDWSFSNYEFDRSAERYIDLDVPRAPRHHWAHHGIVLEHEGHGEDGRPYFRSSGFAVRIDYRGERGRISVGREGFRNRSELEREIGLWGFLFERIEEHRHERTDDDFERWRYLHRLAEKFGPLSSKWCQDPLALRLMLNGEAVYGSLEEYHSCASFTFVRAYGSDDSRDKVVHRRIEETLAAKLPGHVLIHTDLAMVVAEIRDTIFGGCSISCVMHLGDGYAVTFIKGSTVPSALTSLSTSGREQIVLTPPIDSRVFAFNPFARAKEADIVAINPNSDLLRWLLSVRDQYAISIPMQRSFKALCARLVRGAMGTHNRREAAATLDAWLNTIPASMRIELDEYTYPGISRMAGLWEQPPR